MNIYIIVHASKHLAMLDLCELLLDEEGPQIAQLPRTGRTEHNHLYDGPSDHPRVDRLRLISKLCLSFPLEDLLPPDILQSRIQILDLLHHLAQFVFITTLYVACLAYRQIELELDAACSRAREEEAGTRRNVLRCEAHAMIA